MAPRAENPNSLSGPTGPSLLDQSNATPADINPEIFKSRNPERQPTEGTVSSDYLKRTREEDPWPAESSCAPKTNAPAKTATVTLSDCRIDTPTEDLATDQPFQMSCQATTSDGSPLKGDIRFKLYCTLPDGTEEFTNHTVIGKRNGDRYAAEGTLFSPKKPVEWGAPLKYHVVAEHPGAAEKEKSGEAEVVGYMPPKPSAAFEINEHMFHDHTSILKPDSGEIFRRVIVSAKVGGYQAAILSVSQGKTETSLSTARMIAIQAAISGGAFINALGDEEMPYSWGDDEISFLYATQGLEIDWESYTSTSIISAYIRKIVHEPPIKLTWRRMLQNDHEPHINPPGDDITPYISMALHRPARLQPARRQG